MLIISPIGKKYEYFFPQLTKNIQNSKKCLHLKVFFFINISDILTHYLYLFESAGLLLIY